MSSKSKNANILYSQLIGIKEDWETRKESSGIIFHDELSQYNTLLDNASGLLIDPDIISYKASDEFLSSSAKGNKYIYPNVPLLQIRNLKKYLEGKYKILSPEISFIKDPFLKDKYSLYLLDRRRNSASDTLVAITLELEDRLRRKAMLPETSTGTDLANKALSPITGKLTFDGRSKKEIEGYYNLVKGYFDFIRGKPHHVKEDLGREALYKEIILTDKLISEINNLVEKSYERPATDSDQSVG